MSQKDGCDNQNIYRWGTHSKKQEQTASDPDHEIDESQVKDTGHEVHVT
jgi:hypothetical protein